MTSEHRAPRWFWAVLLVGTLYGSTRISMASPVFSLLFAAGLVGGFAIYLAIHGSAPVQEHWSTWRKAALSVGGLVPALVGGMWAAMTLFGLVQLILDVATWRFSLRSEAIAVASGLSSVIFMSASLFYLRLKARFLYGLSEVVGSIVIAVYFASERPEKMNWLDMNVFIAVMSGAVFVFVRGLDNMHQAIEKADSDPWLSSVFKLIDDRAERRQK